MMATLISFIGILCMILILVRVIPGREEDHVVDHA